MNTKLVFMYFWLFLMSLSCIGRSGRLVKRISSIIPLNPSSWCRVTTQKQKMQCCPPYRLKIIAKYSKKLWKTAKDKEKQDSFSLVVG